MTAATGSGSTLRMGPVRGRPDHAAFFVNCRTLLVDRFRARLGTALEFQGNRAVLVPVGGPLPEDALREVVALTLTYRLWSRAERRHGT